MMSQLQTFSIPCKITGNDFDKVLGREMIAAWKKDGILQIARTPEQDEITRKAYEANRHFFSLPLETKKQCVSDLTYSGYVAVGEEKKGGDKGDFPEVLTLFDDISEDDWRVKCRLPGHGPVPWPAGIDVEYFKARFDDYKNTCADIGYRILQLTALGFGGSIDAITRYTKTPWNYMRVLKFPPATSSNVRGIGSHTDYDFLVISSQDEDKTGLYVRPPVDGEKRYRNWMPGESMRGQYEDIEPWNLVAPVPSVFTVFPGDMMQLLTGGELLSTPHKVALYDVERCAMPVFIGPDFMSRVNSHATGDIASFHYGVEMTKRHMEMYPDRVTTRRIVKEERLSILLAMLEKEERCDVMA